jgi:hypothetical protein
MMLFTILAYPGDSTTIAEPSKFALKTWPCVTHQHAALVPFRIAKEDAEHG